MENTRGLSLIIVVNVPLLRWTIKINALTRLWAKMGVEDRWTAYCRRR